MLSPSIEINGTPKPNFLSVSNSLNKKVSAQLNFLKKKNIFLFMVTNQPDVSRGIRKIKDIKKENVLISKFMNLTDWEMCVHDNKDNCLCRKPKIGMFEKLTQKWKIVKDDHQCYMIGDRKNDMIAGKNFGCINVFIDYKYNETKNFKSFDYSFSSTEKALDYIIDKHF